MRVKKEMVISIILKIKNYTTENRKKKTFAVIFHCFQIVSKNTKNHKIINASSIPITAQANLTDPYYIPVTTLSIQTYTLISKKPLF